MASAAPQSDLSRDAVLDQVLAEVPIRSSVLVRYFTPLSIATQVGLDFFSVVTALGVAYKSYRLLHLGQYVYYPKGPFLLISGVVALGFVLLMERYGLYRPGSSLLHVRETEAILRGTMLSTAVFFMASYLSLKFLPSRWIIGLAFLLVLALVELERAVYYSLLRRLYLRGYGVDRALIWGCSEAGIQVFRKLAQSPRAGVLPVAFVDDNPNTLLQRVHESSYTRLKSISVVGTGGQLEEILPRLGITRLILAEDHEGAPTLDRMRETCDRHGVRISIVHSHDCLPQHRVSYQDLDGVMLANLLPLEESNVYRVTKILMDLAVSGLLLVVLAPLFGAIALIICLTDGRPAFFLHDRVGKNGRIFRMWKFRTMYQDTVAYAPTPREASDPRITLIGRWLRRTSLDELPQLVNVLRGEMSLVGPRPEMPFIVEKYTPAQRERLSVEPGLTGLWQISADRAFEIHENIDYDLYYIRNRSLMLDCVILLHTLVFAIRGVGAL